MADISASCESDSAEDIDSGSEEEEENLDHVPIKIPRPMNDEEYGKYMKQASESQGFDVEKFGGYLCGGVVPFDILDKDREELCVFCKQAMQTYTTEKNANYEFLELVKANNQSVAGRMYYITFKARALSDQTCVIFQAKVWKKLFGKGSEVILCRKKPTQ